MNTSRVHSGMERERNVHCTSAHSPEPRRTISITSVRGKTPSMYSRPGPHSGAWSGGRLWSHTWRPATAAPAIAASVIVAP